MMSAPGLLAWQWEGYARYHQSRANLLMHIVLVPLFLAGTVTLALGILRLDWIEALMGTAGGWWAAFRRHGAGSRMRP